MGEAPDTSSSTAAEEKPWHSSSTHFRALQDLMPQLFSQYRTYEDALFLKVKGGLKTAKEHPAITTGAAALTGLLLARGSRRFLLRHTLGRFQSEEARFLKADKNVKEMKLSVDLMKKESGKLMERTALAEKDMNRGQNDLMNAGGQMHILARSVRKAEADAADLMDVLREIPGREALKFRAELPKASSTLQTYIVHVQPPESTANSVISHADLDQWYKTFLPPTGAAKIVFSYHNVISGFAVICTPEDIKTMETKPGFLMAMPEEIMELDLAMPEEIMELDLPSLRAF